MHRRFLARFVRPGARVLEVGAGPGRFTTELAPLGATAFVTDVSPVQLDLNKRYVGSIDAEAAVERRELLDVCDAGRRADDEFDAVLAFGGPPRTRSRRPRRRFAGSCASPPAAVSCSVR